MLESASLEPHAHRVRRAAAAVRTWAGVLSEARRHHLSPLVARSLRRCNVECPISAQLGEDWQRTRALNVVRLCDVREVLQALVGAGVVPVVLKGLALLETMYRDLGLRDFCDLDVLLRADDLKAAEAALLALGFREEPTLHDRAWYENYYYHLRFYRRAEALLVELHWDLGRRPHPFNLDCAAMIDRSVALSVAEVGVRSLDREDLLLHLIVHLSWGNGFDGHLRGLVDIAELIRRGVDWPRFLHRAELAALEQASLPTLELAQWLLRAEVPGEVLASLRLRAGGPVTRFVVAKAQERVFGNGRGRRTLLRLCWLKRPSARYSLLRENFSLDRRPATLLASAKNALSVLWPGRS